MSAITQSPLKASSSLCTLSTAWTRYATAQSAARTDAVRMPVRMVEVHVLIDSLTPLNTAAPPETRCFLSFKPDPKEVEAKDSKTLSKATHLCFCDEVIDRVAHGYGFTRGASNTGTVGTGTVLDFSTPQYTAYLYCGVAGIHGLI